MDEMNNQLEVSESAIEVQAIPVEAEICDDPELEWYAEQINLQHQGVIYSVTEALYNAREAGKLLIEAKKKVPHGQWLNWVEAKFEGSARTAQAYIQVSEGWGDIEPLLNAQSSAHLVEAVSISKALKFLRSRKGEPPLSAAEPPKLPPAPPQGSYNCIVIDPPWFYTLRKDDETHRNRIPYEPMTAEQIYSLPVPSLCPEGVLWLWTTNNHIPEAVEAMSRWGFEIKTVLTWVKVSKTAQVAMGTGNWLRGATEHCFLAVRGEVKAFSSLQTLKTETTVLFAERREHSRKPDEFYQIVETLFPGATRLEMFARQVRPGWDAWGDQTDYFDKQIQG
ncbi:MT-A70 family methyltransferase [Vacuolonema iberomarrocanum]|uniref:MT-A70 family methyltransferase n=1 Tax=Vacuolonema iberomarrocanum TaxID=3454632 RepID=UPI0019F78DCF|nr:DUF3102 domain-containing protein [filamentous cyanobacterium LEGE 07170]